MRCALGLLALAATASAHVDIARRGDMVLPTKQQGELDGQWEIARENVTFSFYFTCTAAECYENVAGAGRGLISANYITSNLLAAYNQRMAAAAASSKAEFLREIPHNYDEFSRYADAVFAQATAADLHVDRMVEDMAGLGDMEDPIYVRTSNNLPVSTENPDYWNVFVRATMMNVPNADLVFGKFINPTVTQERSYEAMKFADDDFESVIYQFDANLAAVAVNWGSVWVSSTAHLITDQLEPTPGRGHKDHKYLLPLLLGVSAMLLVPIILTLVLVYLKKGTRREESWVKVLDKHVDLMTKRNNAKQSEIDTLKQREEHISKDIRKREVEMQERAAYDLLDDDEVDWRNSEKSLKQKIVEKVEEVADKARDLVIEEPEPEPKPVDRSREAGLIARVLTAQARSNTEFEPRGIKWRTAEAARRETLRNSASGRLGIMVEKDNAGEDRMTVGKIAPNTGAEKSGLKVGDMIVGCKLTGRGGQDHKFPLPSQHNMSSVIGPNYGVFEGTAMTMLYIRDADDKKYFAEQREKLGNLGDNISPEEAMEFFKCTVRDGRNMVQQVKIEISPESAGSLKTRKKNLIALKEDLIQTEPRAEKIDVELLMKFINEPKLAQEYAEKVFKKADKDGGGSLDQAELSAVIGELWEALGLNPPSDELVKSMFFMMDESVDNEVSFDEFFPYFRSVFLSSLIADLSTDPDED